MNQHIGLLRIACGVALTLVACAAAPPQQVGEETPTSEPPSAPPPEAGSGTPEAPPAPEKKGLNEEQEQQMMIALKRGGEKASKCAEVVPDAVKGEGEVKVTFDGQKGRVTEAVVGAPFAGTPVEACIKRSFVGEIVLPFEGEPKEVPYTVKLGVDKKAPPPGDKKTPPPADKKKK